MSSDAVTPRLFIATDGNRHANGALPSALMELNGKLQQAGVQLASLFGLPYKECLSKFDADWLGELVRLLEATDTGWFVQGIWGKPSGSGDVAEVLERSIYSFNLSLRSVHCLSSVGIRTLRQVVARTEYELLHIK